MKGFLKKITIPTKKELFQTTLIVLVAMIIISVIIFGVDTAFTEIYTLIRNAVVGTAA